MKRLETKFAGLQLKNPFIVSSCNLTNSAEKNKKWEDASASAVVLKSLFEEEIEAEADGLQTGVHAEEQDYLLFYHRAHRLEEYLRLIRETKKLCTIPVIASINCFRLTEWTAFAKEIELAGADALELNVMSVCSELDYQPGQYEQLHIDIVADIKRTVRIPVVVKLGKNLTNPIPLIQQLYAQGAAGVVLFNRMVTPDIDVEKMSYTVGEVLGRPSDLYDSLRWIGLASDRVPRLAYAASGGVSDGISIVKAILAGASAVEVCSVLYRKKENAIKEMLDVVEKWMNDNNYDCIADFKGMMNAGKAGGGTAFERVQFFKRFGKYE